MPKELSESFIANEDPRIRAINVMVPAVSSYRTYYDSLRLLSDAELRRMWMKEGRRRGYEVN